jgi:hypothetical protein
MMHNKEDGGKEDTNVLGGFDFSAIEELDPSLCKIHIYD